MDIDKDIQKLNNNDKEKEMGIEKMDQDKEKDIGIDKLDESSDDSFEPEEDTDESIDEEEVDDNPNRMTNVIMNIEQMFDADKEFLSGYDFEDPFIDSTNFKKR